MLSRQKIRERIGSIDDSRYGKRPTANAIPEVMSNATTEWQCPSSKFRVLSQKLVTLSGKYGLGDLIFYRLQEDS
jgi:hypothetical protein